MHNLMTRTLTFNVHVCVALCYVIMFSLSTDGREGRLTEGDTDHIKAVNQH